MESPLVEAGLLDAVHLPLGPDLGLELGNRPQHIEQQAPGRITGVDTLIEDLEINLLALEFVGDLAQ